MVEHRDGGMFVTHHPECEDATGEYPGSCTCALIKRREAMDKLIAQDADLIDVETGQ